MNKRFPFSIVVGLQRTNLHFVPTVVILIVCGLVQQASYGCTVFVAARDGRVLVGNNEDYFNPQTKIWFVPRKNGNNGHVLFGWENEYNLPMGGMNTKGLVFDWLAVPAFVVGNAPKQDPYHRLASAVHRIMRTCDTVDSALQLIKGVDRSGRWEAVLFVSDASGDAALVDGDAVVRKDPGKDFFVATNFRQSITPEEHVTCNRHQLVTSMLTRSNDLNIDLARDALDSTHAESPGATLYSNIYDPKNLRIHLYHFHDFRTAVEIDLKQELKKPKRAIDIPTLFQPNVAAKAYAAALVKDMPPATQLARPANDYVGRYGTNEYYFEIRREDDNLWVYPSTGLRAPLIPVGRDRFVSKRLGTLNKHEFYNDSAGRIAVLLVRRNGRTTVLRRNDTMKP